MLRKESSSKIIEVLKLGVDPLSIIITSIATLTFSVVGSLVKGNEVLETIFDKGFYISLSVIILQTLIQNFFLNEDTESIKSTIKELNEKSKSSECVIFPEKKSYINNKIEDVLNSHKVRKMRIICYGTSKFGRIIDAVITTFTTVQVDVIVCSPDENVIDLRLDKQLLKNVIEEMAMVDNIHIFASLTPPTIRACAMYGDNENPIWCSMQSYYFFPDDIYKLFKGEGFSPTIISNADDELMLKHLMEIFDKEFYRLMDKSKEITPDIIIQRRQNGTW